MDQTVVCEHCHQPFKPRHANNSNRFCCRDHYNASLIASREPILTRIRELRETGLGHFKIAAILTKELNRKVTAESVAGLRKRYG